jgi:hypothetical protein
MDYLVLHCEVASAIWSAFFSRLGCPELCLCVLLTCMTIGSPLVGQRVQRCGNCAYMSLLVFVEEINDRNLEDREVTRRKFIFVF